MSDIRTYFFSFDRGCDWQMAGPSLAEDDGLHTAVVLSLFTDARATPDDELPPGQTDRRGWWGDSYAAVAGDRFGSRLWLLSREKQTQAVVNRAREYAREALQWMIDDGIAEQIIVDAIIPRNGVLALEIVIVRPRGDELQFRFETSWNRTRNAV